MSNRRTTNPATDPPCGICTGTRYSTTMPLCAACRDRLNIELVNPFDPSDHDGEEDYEDLDGTDQ